jgi:capsular polysaccharide biosynthesis protein
VRKYREIQAQLDEANRAETLESEQKGERFTLLEPPRLPTQPVSPNRPFIFFIGLIFAIAASAGLVITLETIDTTIRGSKDVVAILGAPPLATIPTLMNKSDIAASLRHRIFISAGFVGVIALVITILL